jgi:hypothetical protein
MLFFRVGIQTGLFTFDMILTNASVGAEAATNVVAVTL